MKKDRKNEILGVLFLLLGLFTITSLFFFHKGDIPYYTSHPSMPVENHTGIIGAYLSFGLFLIFGLSAFVIPIIFLLWSWCYFLQNVPEKKFFKFLGLMVSLFSTSTIIAISVSPDFRFEGGGVVGYLIGTHLLEYFGYLGSFILASSCFLLSVLLATDFLIYPILKKFSKNFGGYMELASEYFEEFKEWFAEKIEDYQAAREEKEQEKTNQTKSKKKQTKQQVADIAPKTLPETTLKVKRYRQDYEAKKEKKAVEDEIKKTVIPPPVKKLKPMPDSVARIMGHKPKENTPQPVKSEKDFEGVIGSSEKEERSYQLPPMDLLKHPDPTPAGQDDDLQENSRILESTLREFGIEVKVTEVEQGPVITRYELLPAPGVKVNSISSLSDDLALALKARSVRLIIPIPGKSAVGVEVPNSVSSTVFVREIIDDPRFDSDKYTLPLALGKNTSGKTMVSDLTTMPHMLIAGTTGSGKTVSVNAIILGLLYKLKPSELKFIMIDPKMVELAVYNKLPHMLSPVVTDVRKASHTLNWVVNEMEKRYKLLATVGVRNIKSFNEREISEEDQAQIKAAHSENVVPAKLPYIVVIVDELADLMMVAQDKVETAIARLAQLSRAVGIHLILATQRPSVDVITGVIKANFPARISFKVASKVDSRTVIDGNGADKLLGRGDMLFVRPGDEKPTRGQAPLVIDAEINAVVEFIQKQGEPEYHEEITSAQSGKAASAAAQEKDELFDEAVRIVLETKQASTSSLQRRMRLGYTRAARIIDQMEAEGIVGPSQGAKPREILISETPDEAMFEKVAPPAAELPEEEEADEALEETDDLQDDEEDDDEYEDDEDDEEELDEDEEYEDDEETDEDEDGEDEEADELEEDDEEYETEEEPAKK